MPRPPGHPRSTSGASAPSRPSRGVSASERRRPRHPGGVTLLETLVSLYLLFLISVYLLQLFAGGCKALDRSVEFTTATFLAQEEMEQVLPQDVVVAAQGNFNGDFADYSYAVSTSEYSPTLQRIEVDVRGRHGVTAALVALKAGPPDFAGISTDQSSCDATFRRQQNLQPDCYVPPTFALPQALPDSGEASGIACDDTGSVSFVADRYNCQLWYYDVNATGSPWSGPFHPDTGMGTPAGVATDSFANEAWVSDQSNRAIWKFYNGIWTRVQPSNPPLGVPAGIATDAAASNVWVVDTTNQCVRRYNDDMQTWDPTCYGAGSLQDPRGVVAPHGGQGRVYIVDSTHLWSLDTGTGVVTSVATLPSGLHDPSGLASDRFGSSFWINSTHDRAIWYLPSTTATAVEIGVP